MSLWDVESFEKTVKGIKFNGYKDGALVKVYTPQELDKIGGHITENTINELYRRLGISAGSEVYIIAPRGKFAFASDEIDGDGNWDVNFYFLRIPNSMTERFTDNFSAQIQASDTDSVNNAIDTIGFDFIRPPKVDFKIENNTITKYIYMLAISYYLIKIEKFKDIINVGDEENCIMSEAKDLLSKHKFYSLTAKSKALEAAASYEEQLELLELLDDIIAENNISNANLHLMFDKIVIEETDEGLNLDLRLKSPFISKKKEPLLKKYMIVDNEVLSVGA